MNKKSEAQNEMKKIENKITKKRKAQPKKKKEEKMVS